jgi:hypothetical protein
MLHSPSQYFYKPLNNQMFSKSQHALKKRLVKMSIIKTEF